MPMYKLHCLSFAAHAEECRRKYTNISWPHIGYRKKKYGIGKKIPTEKYFGYLLFFSIDLNPNGIPFGVPNQLVDNKCKLITVDLS